MKFFQIVLFVIFSVTFSIIPVWAEDQQPAVLESISFQRDAVHGETINFKLNGTHLPKIFAIKGEKPRVVFDFLDTRYSDLINKIIETEGDLVKRVRIGLHNEPTPKTRVVVDLAPLENFAWEHEFIAEDNILTISIFEAEPKDTKVAKEETSKKEDKVVAAPEIPVFKKSNTKQLVKAVEETQKGTSTKVEEPVVSVEKKEDVQPPVAGQKTKYPTATEVFGAKEEKNVETAVITPEVTKEEPAASSNPHILEITYEDTSDKGEMVHFKLNDFYPPIVFGIEKGQPRVVCDFINTEIAKDVELLIESNGKYIEKIRTAKHQNPDKVRVVLDLVANKNYDLQQVFFKEDNLFVIIVNSFDEYLPNLPASK